MQTELNITGMTCGHCVKAVEKALGQVEGVQSVQVDLASGKATVQGQARTEQLLAAVAEEGYAAQVAQ